jgi:anti-sigma factor ChrR (cupin superfamily)
MSDPKESAVTEEQQQDAALAALGLLSSRDAKAVPRRAIAEMTEAATLLAAAVAPQSPPPAVKTRLLSRVAAFEALRPVADVRQGEGDWRYAGLPGVEMKQLFHEAGTGRSTFLLRMEAGARLPAHHHGDLEQCLVLKGDIRWGDLVYEEGDFMVMGKDTAHPELHTINGNLLLLISGHNEYERL